MNNRLDEDLYNFADNGTDKKDEILRTIMRKTPVRPKIRYGKYVAAAISACLIIAVIGNFNVIANSISNIINTLWPAESIMMNELGTNTLQELIDARIAANINPADIEDDGSIVYQILYKPVETPCYVYAFYYRGHLTCLVLDKNTKNINEVEEWLRNNGGIVAKLAETPKEAAKLFEEGGSTKIIPSSEIKQVMGNGCMLPGYLPEGEDNSIAQYNENISYVNIKYLYEVVTDITTNKFISLTITNTNNKLGSSLIANLAVTKNIEITQINGWDVYISDSYYVWKADGFVYVLYLNNFPHEEGLKIIENMR